MSWEEFEKELQKLAASINSPVDIIVPIARGGFVPGRLLASRLNVKTMYALTVIKTGDKRFVVTEITENLQGKNILLVEDMLESGKSMVAAKKYLEKKGAYVKTACLYTMPQSRISPDYSIGQVRDTVSFPWE